MLHNHLIIFPFCRYIHSHGYIYEQIMIGPVHISTIVHPSAQASSLLCLLRCTPEYLRKLRNLRYSEIWNNTIVRGCNTKVEAKSLPPTPVLQTSLCSVLPLNNKLKPSPICHQNSASLCSSITLNSSL